MKYPLHYASKTKTDGPVWEIKNPWSKEPLAHVVLCEAQEAEAAIQASLTAHAHMKTLSRFERRQLLYRIAQRLTEKKEEFARWIALDAGKPLALARTEVVRAISVFELSAEELSRPVGEVLPLDLTPNTHGYQGLVTRVCLGPVLAIGPFNFPLNLLVHKIAPALALGTSVIVKPPPQAPIAALELAKLLVEAGTPENAVQVLPCENSLAETLAKDERFAVLSFTGSPAVGWRLKNLAGKKKVLLELGGNAAAIVHEDADTNVALERIVNAAYAYAGQVCIKVQRLYVHRPIAQKFIDALKDKVSVIAPHDPLQAKALMGPMIDEGNAQRVQSWLEEAKAAGVDVWIEGKRDGARLGPSLLGFTGTGEGLRVVDEEVFGPVLCVRVYDTWPEALALANRSRYGLQAGIFTDSQKRMDEAFAQLTVGGLIVNDVPTLRVDSMPYGGVRDSGFGREGVHYAMQEMSELKVLVRRTSH